MSHLRDSVRIAADCVDLLLESFSLGRADELDALGFSFSSEDSRLRLVLSACQVGLTFGKSDSRQLIGASVSGDATSFAFALSGLSRRLSLAATDRDCLLSEQKVALVVSVSHFALGLGTSALSLLALNQSLLRLLGDHALLEGLHENVGRLDLADERVDAFDIVLAQHVADVLASRLLSLCALIDELEHGRRLSSVAEVIADQRLEHVLDKVGHAAEARDEARRHVIGDVDDLLDFEQEVKAILRADADRLQAMVESMVLALGRPVQHEVRRRYELDLHGRCVDRVLARIPRLDPDAAAAVLDDVTVLVVVAGQVLADLTNERIDDADMGNRNHSHRDDVHSDEPWVDHPGARHDDFFLDAAIPTGSDEGMRVLERLMPIDLRCGNDALRKLLAIMRGDLADRAIADREKLKAVGVDAVLVSVLRRDDVENSRVDTVRSSLEDHHLSTLGAAANQECARILEVRAVDRIAKRAIVRELFAGLSDDQGNLALRNSDRRDLVDTVEPWEHEEVPVWSKRVSLHAGLAVDRNDLARLEVRAELLGNDADFVVANDDDADRPEE